MAVSTDSVQTDDQPPAAGSAQGSAVVDPRAPRFGQTVTTLGFGAAGVFDVPGLVYAVTAVLVAAVVSGWRLDAYALVWRRVMVPVVGPPAETEPAAPHRFARVLGAAGGTLSSAVLLAGVPIAGYAVAGAVALLAGLAAATGLCLGCRMYRQVRVFRNLGLV